MNEAMREERKMEAQRILKLAEKYPEKVNNAFEDTIYVPYPMNYGFEIRVPGVNVLVRNTKKDKKNVIHFTFYDTVTALRQAHERFKNDEDIEKICVLNFASYKKPGGGFLKGSKSQEEDICMSSFLYPVLAQFKPAYDLRKKRNGEYGNDLFYSTDMPFLNESKTEFGFYADVISCSAPNRGVMLKKGINESYITKILMDRIESVFKIAILNNVDCLILGAFGTGVYKNNVFTVASVFDMMCEKYHRFFKDIIFAIPDQTKLNIFKEVLK